MGDVLNYIRAMNFVQAAGDLARHLQKDGKIEFAGYGV